MMGQFCRVGYGLACIFISSVVTVDSYREEGVASWLLCMSVRTVAFISTIVDRSYMKEMMKAMMGCFALECGAIANVFMDHSFEADMTLMLFLFSGFASLFNDGFVKFAVLLCTATFLFVWNARCAEYIKLNSLVGFFITGVVKIIFIEMVRNFGRDECTVMALDAVEMFFFQYMYHFVLRAKLDKV